MLKKISIQGFKSVYDVQDLELGRVNVFIGANGSGKTNLLEAVGMLSAAASGRVDSESLSRRGVRLSVPHLYRTSLKSQATSQQITLKAVGEWNEGCAEASASLSKSKSKSKSMLDSPTMEAGQWGYQLSNNDQITTHQMLAHGKLKGAASPLHQHLLGMAIYSPTTPVLRGIQPDIAPRDPVGLLGGRLAEAISDILDQPRERLGSMDLEDLFDLLDWVDEFDITSPSRELLSPDVPSLRSVVRFTDYWMNETRNQLSGYDANEGALYVLFMLILALHPRMPRFFAVENFDHSLNPRLTRALARLFCQLIVESDPPRQVLLTTHNPLVLDGLDLSDDRIRLFAVERTRSTGGATQVYRIQVSDEVLNATPEGLPLSNLWVMGRLGGVPNLF